MNLMMAHTRNQAQKVQYLELVKAKYFKYMGGGIIIAN